MRLSLSQQFVAAVLTLTLTVVLASLLLARWSFERGFSEHMVVLESQRLAELAAVLLQDYDIEAGWSGLSRRDFYRALRVVPPPVRQGPARQQGPGGFRPDHPRPGPDDVRRLPPERRREALREMGLRVPPTALFDRQGAAVMAHGRQAIDGSFEMLSYMLVLDGETVGELRSWAPPRLDLTRESGFARQQALASVVIFVVAMLLALLLALWLAAQLLAPLRRAHAALGDLAAGNFAARLDSPRSDELGALMGDIDRLAEALETNQSARRRWIADISHELRTPVAILKAELEAIEDGLRPFDTAQLNSLQAEVERIIKLIEDLYQLSTADLGALSYEYSELDLGDLLSDIVGATRPRFEQQGLELELRVEKRCSLRGDQQRLEQLMRNVLENSLAYTDAPGRTRVSLDCAEGWLRLSVEDSAPGVSPEALPLLFDPLYREDESRSRRRAGAGLGLAIALSIVEAHGGSMSAEASALGGLALQIRLPELGR